MSHFIVVLRKKNNEGYHNDPGHDSEVWKSPELFGPGQENIAAVPTALEQSTGKERIEYMSLLDGKDPYYGLMDPLHADSKGTKTKPIEVLSPDDDRIVGCSGIERLLFT